MNFSNAFHSSSSSSKRKKQIAKLTHEINQNLSDLETILAKTQAAKQAVATLKQEAEKAKRKQPFAKEVTKNKLLLLLSSIGLWKN